MMSPPTSRQRPVPSWQARALDLTTFTTWNMQALIAVRMPNDVWSAHFQWEQKPSSYTLLLSAPLSVYSLELHGEAEGVTLKMADGKMFSAKTPEVLLQEQTHLNLPVSNLYYWIRSLPVPGKPSQKRWDENHRLIELVQDGWTIRYLQYTAFENRELPQNIQLTTPGWLIKIVVKQWR